MKFRRSWKVVFRDLYCLFTLLFLLLLFTVIIPLIKARDLFGFIYITLVFLGFLLMCIFAFYLKGDLTDYIFFNEDSIVLRQKGNFLRGEVKEKTELRWEDISTIVRTRYLGGKALIFWDKYGQEIWFDHGEKIEWYIRDHHPELEPLFPPEDDIRKWQEWDKKL